MALKATIFKVDLQVADLDRGHFADYALTIARPPSETAERTNLSEKPSLNSNQRCRGTNILELKTDKLCPA